MSIVQEKMYMDVDDVCAILGVSKAYAYNLMREYNKELSYSHEYPVDSVTVSYYDDAENNNLLFTVYSDGTAIVNSQFVKVKAPKGGAEEVYQKLAEIVK